MSLFNRKKKYGSDSSNADERTITLYSCLNDVTKIAKSIENAFNDSAAQVIRVNEDCFNVQLQDGTAVKFFVTVDAAKLKTQTNGMANFFSQSPLSNEQVKSEAIHQILLFQSIIGITFEVNSDENRTGYIMDRIMEIADSLAAFVLYPNMYLYQYDNKLLISIDGKTDFDKFYPIAPTDLFKHPEKETDADIKRKEKSIAVLKEKNIPFIEHMCVSAYDSDSVIPSKSDMIHRLTAIFATSVKAEIYTCGEYDDDPVGATKEILASLEKLYHFSEYLSGEEKAYIDNASPSASEHNRFGWRYECCSVILWALSMMELKKPTEICDASEIGHIIWNNDFDSLMKKAVVRSREEIMDIQDLVYRYDWACVEARINGKKSDSLNGEIIYEWHYTLNWLTTVDGITDWDSVSPRT